MAKTDTKTVWITGASSGIGKEAATQYAQRGCHLIISARNQEKLSALQKELSTASSVEVLPLDLSYEASIIKAAEYVKGKFVKVDLVFHAGGISQRSYLKDTSVEVDRRIMEVNYFGTIILTKAVLPSMLRSGGGQFAVVSSLVGIFGYGVRSAYSASKHALHGFFESLELELGSEGIHSTIICPGGVRTNISVNALMGDGRPSGEMDEMQSRGMPVKRAVAKMISAIDRKKRLLILGSAKEKFGVLVYRIWPSLFFKIAQKQNPRGAVKL